MLWYARCLNGLFAPAEAGPVDKQLQLLVNLYLYGPLTV